MDSEAQNIKVILLGSSGVGKTSLLTTFLKGDNENITPTISPENHVKEIINGRNVKVKLNIWDTAGQEQYQSIISAYFRSVQVALICFDYENRNDFQKWIQPVLEASPNATIILVITKRDLLSNEKINEMEKIAENYISDESNKAVNFFVTSAFEKDGINELFGYIANCDIITKTESTHEIVPQDGSGNKSCCS